MDQSEQLQTAIYAAKTASRIVLDAYNSGNLGNVAKKGRVERVSDVDLNAEKEIRKILQDKFPIYGISGEEYGDTKEHTEYKWYIDPLCGSNEYIHGLPEFGLSIALTHNDELILGVCSLPAFDEIFWAEKGKGAYCNGEKISVSSVEDLDEAIFTTHVSVKFDNIDPAVELLSKIGRYNMLIPGAFPYAVCNLARGRVDGHIEVNVRPVHRLAATMIAIEAGGVWTKTDGDKASIFDNNIVITNGVMHKKVIEMLNS